MKYANLCQCQISLTFRQGRPEEFGHEGYDLLRQCAFRSIDTKSSFPYNKSSSINPFYKNSIDSHAAS